MSWHDEWFVLLTKLPRPEMPAEPDAASGTLMVTAQEFDQIVVMVDGHQRLPFGKLVPTQPRQLARLQIPG